MTIILRRRFTVRRLTQTPVKYIFSESSTNVDYEGIFINIKKLRFSKYSAPFLTIQFPVGFERENAISIGNRSFFSKQLGINCTREQIGLFSNFHEWLPQPRVEIRKSPICSQVQLIPNCFEKKDRFPFNNTATVNTSFYLTSFRYRGLFK